MRKTPPCPRCPSPTARPQSRLRLRPQAGSRIGLRRVVDRAHGDRGGRRAGVFSAVVVDRRIVEAVRAVEVGRGRSRPSPHCRWRHGAAQDDRRAQGGVAVERAVQRQAGDAERRHRALDVRARQRDRNRGCAFEPKPDPALVSGASLTAPTVIEAVAGLASSAPLLSIAAYLKLVGPLKLAAAEVDVAALPQAATVPPRTMTFSGRRRCRACRSTAGW